MPLLVAYCKHCGEPIIQPWDGKDMEGKNGWRHFIFESKVYYYYCDRSEETHAELKSNLMKTGIAVDDYKLEAFKERLKQDGFDNFEVVPFKNDTSIIQVQHDFNRVLELKKLCTELEFHFKRRN